MASFMNLGLVLALTVGVADAAQLRENKPWSGCGPLPHFMRKNFALLQNPGAGVESAMAPFEESFKDGFAHTICILDQMLLSGDKHGNGKFSYKLGDTQGVAIVNYNDHVPKEDREKMTQTVCFEFCRTIEEMVFFGLSNGGNCYCMPYFTQQAGDSSACDTVCDGNTEQMCGGKSKSDIFEMHTCGKADERLDKARKTLNIDLQEFLGVNSALDTAASSMQAAAEKLQKSFGNVGDGPSSDLCQEAKEFAGEMGHVAEAGNRQLEEGSNLLASGDATNTGDRAKEALTDKLTKSIEATEKASKDSSAYAKVGIAPVDVTGSPGELYRPVMYFVDKEFQEEPSTCGGKLAAAPLIGTYAGCAVACEMKVGKCVGFQFMPTGLDTTSGAYSYAYEYEYLYYDSLIQEDEEVQAAPEGLCFLFEKLESAFYYTGCGGASQTTAFLQRESKKVATDFKCVVKGSEFFGTDISPNPSGLCKGCLKKVTKADRCFE
jgi:hypothetical protein